MRLVSRFGGHVDNNHLGGEHGFDFLWGHWHIENRRLRERLTGSNAWETFAARGACRPILGGSGNVDDFVPVEGSNWAGFEGGAIRLYNPSTGQWSIFWFDNVVHRLLPPVLGSFQDGVGTFHGVDEHEGTPVQVKFTWSGIGPTNARWEQAFSADKGETWETNWIMTFTRTEANE